MGYEFDSLYLLKSGIKKFVQKDYQSKIIWTTSSRLYELQVQDYVDFPTKFVWTTSPRKVYLGLLFCRETVGRKLDQMDY